MVGKRKTPEEIVALVNDVPLIYSKDDRGLEIARLAYKEADKHPQEGTWNWAYQMMKEGKKVRLPGWVQNEFHYMLDGYVTNEYGERPPMVIHLLDATDWELYQEKKPVWSECDRECAEDALRMGLGGVQACVGDDEWHDVYLCENQVIRYADSDDSIIHKLDRKWRLQIK